MDSCLVLALVVVGLVSGILTALSPCVLPVLPGVLAASALPSDEAGRGGVRRWRPVVVVASLVITFAVVTLSGGALLSSLGLPQDVLRVAGIAVLTVVGLGLLVPPFGRILERPFAAVGRLAPRGDGSALVLGASLGLVFVPCAGPVLAAVVVLSATQGVSGGLLALAAAFAVGLAIPLVLLGILGQRVGERALGVRRRLPVVRGVAGGLLLASAVAIALGAVESVQRVLPDYVASAQEAVADDPQARQALAGLVEVEEASTQPEQSFNECEADPSVLANCGPARPITGIATWLNTADGEPVDLESLRGKVVLVDFWTFGCINCQRTTPYLTSWDATYRDQGLVVLGIHSPEFDYERDVDNVRAALAEAGIEYPVALDNDFRTWRAWSQRYWPARYLIDRDGVVRLVHYGEGAYEQTEQAIQQLLAQREPATRERSVGAGG